MARKRREDLRSHRWFGVSDLRSFGHRSRAKQMGYAGDDYLGKPVIGIVNTWSDINPWHHHFRERAEEVERGVWQAGGFPIELPAMSLSEPFVKPTTMLYRNFLAMEAEESLRSHPVDGAVLMGGCDKTTPALLMAAFTVDLPAVYMPGGPMLRGNMRGQRLGSGSDTWKYWAELRAGRIDERTWKEVEDGIARSPGHCMTMGTASTMISIAEALGLTPPGAASIPAADSNHARMASACGRLAVEAVWEDRRPSTVVDRGSIENAVVVDMVRISNARMSGTSYGACVLHVAPESAVGGPLALVRDGDEIELDVAGRRLVLHVADDEIARRRAAWTPPPPHYGRGFGALHARHVSQANEGCDFDFLLAGPPVPEPEIH